MASKISDYTVTTSFKILTAFMTISLTVMIIFGWEFFRSTSQVTLVTSFILGLATQQKHADIRAKTQSHVEKSDGPTAINEAPQSGNAHYTIIFQYIYVIVLFFIGIILGGVKISANALTLFCLVSAAYYVCFKIVQNSPHSLLCAKMMLINFLCNALTSYVLLNFMLSTLHRQSAHAFVIPIALVIGWVIARYEQQRHKFDLLRIPTPNKAVTLQEFSTNLQQISFKLGTFVLLSLFIIILDCTILETPSYQQLPLVLIVVVLPLAFCWRFVCHIRNNQLD